MNLQPIKMTRFEARETLRQYQALLKERRTAEDLAIIRSAKAIAKGQQVIRLGDAIRAGGVDAKNLPRIAIARADDPFVRLDRWNGGCRMVGLRSKNEWINEWGRNWRSVEGRVAMAKPRGFRFNLDGIVHSNQSALAMVPSIPPAYRPLDEHLDRFYILFEAVWETHVAPTDPALLSPLGGGMFAVVAVWDLTDLERAVLAGARGA